MKAKTWAFQPKGSAMQAQTCLMLDHLKGMVPALSVLDFLSLFCFCCLSYYWIRDVRWDPWVGTRSLEPEPGCVFVKSLWINASARCITSIWMLKNVHNSYLDGKANSLKCIALESERHESNSTLNTHTHTNTNTHTYTQMWHLISTLAWGISLQGIAGEEERETEQWRNKR